VLGANDGIVSTASLVLGVAAAGADLKAILVAGVAGLVAGGMSMAAGEYVSVSSQSDTEHADLERERKELAADPVHEHEEMAAIYVGRGLDEALAAQVATQLMAHDALGAHARDELGISEIGLPARPVQAALALGRQLRGGRRAAAGGRDRLADRAVGTPGRAHGPGGAGDPGRRGGGRRWRERGERRVACGVLGRGGHGRDRRGGRAVRCGDVAPSRPASRSS
jgi:hypothetical protein